MEKPKAYTKHQIAGMLYILSRRDYNPSRSVWKQIDFNQEPKADAEINGPLLNLLHLAAQRARDIYREDWTNVTGKGRMGLSLDTDHIPAVLQEASDILAEAAPATKIGNLRNFGYDKNTLSRAREIFCSDTQVKF